VYEETAVQSTRAAQHEDESLQCSRVREGIVGGARPSLDESLQYCGTRAGVVGGARPSVVLLARDGYKSYQPARE
jgi:hypothetical protein